MVKIDSTSSVSKTALRRIIKSASSGVSSFSAVMGQVDEVEDVNIVSGPHATSSLLFLQEVSETQLAKEKGEKILNLLDQVRVNLLAGDVTNIHLLSLKKNISSYQTNISDLRLKQVLEEIEQRANIELAKRGLI